LEYSSHKESMTPRERWLAVLTRHQPDRVPMDFWATPEMRAKLVAYLGCDSERTALEKLHVDFCVRLTPRYAGPPLPAGRDSFDCGWQDIDYGGGVYSECVWNPLGQLRSVDEVDRYYTWPSPDWWDYGDMAEQVRGYEMYPLRGGGSEPFLRYKYLRGQERAFMDLIENPEMVHYCLGKILDLEYENTRRIFERLPGRVTISYVAEDLGGQDNLLFSPVHIREFILPCVKRMADLVHEAGAFVFHHDDGNCNAVIPDLIRAGIDILNPIQWRANGMDRDKLKHNHGDQIVFHGAMDNQYTLPFGSSDEVRQEVLDNLRILGDGGGYILAPCHHMQAITPPQNIVTMYETCYQHGWT
jgi:uroporphyrinogen decarboxylase